MGRKDLTLPSRQSRTQTHPSAPPTLLFHPFCMRIVRFGGIFGCHTGFTVKSDNMCDDTQLHVFAYTNCFPEGNNCIAFLFAECSPGITRSAQNLYKSVACPFTAPTHVCHLSAPGAHVSGGPTSLVPRWAGRSRDPPRHRIPGLPGLGSVPVLLGNAAPPSLCCGFSASWIPWLLPACFPPSLCRSTLSSNVSKRGRMAFVSGGCTPETVFIPRFHVVDYLIGHRITNTAQKHFFSRF